MAVVSSEWHHHHHNHHRHHHHRTCIPTSTYKHGLRLCVQMCIIACTLHVAAENTMTSHEEAMTSRALRGRRRLQQISACAAYVDGGLVSLEPLQRTDGLPRFAVDVEGWNYTFNPCSSYHMPLESPHSVAGDKCLFSAMCKCEVTAEGELFCVTLGIQSSARFQMMKMIASDSEESSEEDGEEDDGEDSSEEDEILGDNTSEESSEESSEEEEEEHDTGEEGDDDRTNDDDEVVVEEDEGRQEDVVEGVVEPYLDGHGNSDEVNAYTLEDVGKDSGPDGYTVTEGDATETNQTYRSSITTQNGYISVPEMSSPNELSAYNVHKHSPNIDTGPDIKLSEHSHSNNAGTDANLPLSKHTYSNNTQLHSSELNIGNRGGGEAAARELYPPVRTRRYKNDYDTSASLSLPASPDAGIDNDAEAFDVQTHASDMPELKHPQRKDRGKNTTHPRRRTHASDDVMSAAHSLEDSELPTVPPTDLILRMRGIRSQRSVKTFIYLVCSPELRAVNDAQFIPITITPRIQMFELHHLCCCPGACDSTTNLDLEPVSKQEVTSELEDGAQHLWIVVVANAGIIMFGVIIALFCCRKGSSDGPYIFLPECCASSGQPYKYQQADTV